MEEIDYIVDMKETQHKGYFVNEQGEVFSNLRGNIKKLKPVMTNRGYGRVSISSIRKNISVHRLVAEAYLDKPDGCDIVEHLDGNKLNNHVSNLKWSTQSENIKRAHKHGVMMDNRGEKHPNSKLSDMDVDTIVYLYVTLQWPQHKIAKEFGVDQSNISLILNKKRRNWS